MKKLISVLLIFALLPYLTGCYTMNQITKEEFKKSSKNAEIELQTRAGDEYHFEDSYYILSDTLYGQGIKIRDNKETPFNDKIALNDIFSIKQKEFNTGAIVFLGMVAVGTIIVLALTEPWAPDLSSLGNIRF